MSGALGGLRHLVVLHQDRRGEPHDARSIWRITGITRDCRTGIRTKPGVGAARHPAAGYPGRELRRGGHAHRNKRARRLRFPRRHLALHVPGAAPRWIIRLLPSPGIGSSRRSRPEARGC